MIIFLYILDFFYENYKIELKLFCIVLSDFYSATFSSDRNYIAVDLLFFKTSIYIRSTRIR